MAQVINKYIAVAYELYTEMDGKMELTEKAPAEHPFSFISGLGYALEAFENHLVNLNKGDHFDFTLSVDEAYGPMIPEGVQTLPRKVFEINGRLDESIFKIGYVVPLMNEEGKCFNATIKEINENGVIIDMNHPLADKELNFKGEVIECREATNQELQDLLNKMSGEGGCGGCGGCGGDGCEGCGDGGCSNGNCGGCQ